MFGISHVLPRPVYPHWGGRFSRGIGEAPGRFARPSTLEPGRRSDFRANFLTPDSGDRRYSSHVPLPAGAVFGETLVGRSDLPSLSSPSWPFGATGGGGRSSRYQRAGARRGTWCAEPGLLVSGRRPAAGGAPGAGLVSSFSARICRSGGAAACAGTARSPRLEASADQVAGRSGRRGAMSTRVVAFRHASVLCPTVSGDAAPCWCSPTRCSSTGDGEARGAFSGARPAWVRRTPRSPPSVTTARLVPVLRGHSDVADARRTSSRNTVPFRRARTFAGSGLPRQGQGRPDSTGLSASSSPVGASAATRRRVEEFRARERHRLRGCGHQQPGM
ncbi:hypothetical protein G443_000493 [Actinoalloteichus cyanogriseus DSM 43889]|uniref:Uncharacterized protein n=1 Tax=Actinoalloteichus caeruleus DSM 43889 TaxID=1120930 RepID=A0ABT1JDK6_ACTCY|nr:hypothetical protein [Actinoalloteichus caeruleus DSM 43889]